MKQGGNPSGGFTIVETLIVLAVTGLLFVSAATAINGRQGKTEFQTAINNTQQQIQQIINESASGYFPNTNNFTCTVPAATPVISAAGSSQGTNQACVFIGKVAQFGVTSGGNEKLITHALAGVRSAGTISAAEPTDIPQIITSQSLEGGLTTKYMNYADASSGGTVNTTGVGFLAGDSTGLVSTASGNGSLNSGSQQLTLYGIKNTSVGSTTSAGAMTSAIASSAVPGNSDFKIASQVTICLASGTTDQSGLLTISKGLQVSLVIKSGSVC